LYWGLGVIPLVGVAVNSVLAALTIPVLADTTDRLFGRRAAKVVPPFIALLPAFIVWTAQPLREALVLFLLAVATNAAVRLSVKVSARGVLIFTSAGAMMFVARGNVAVAAMLGFLCALVVGRQSLSSGLSLAVSLSALVGVAAIVLASSASLRQLMSQANLSQVDAIRADLSASSGSAFYPGVDVATPAHALQFLPIGLANLILGPLPSLGGSLRQALGVVDTLVMWFLLPSLWRGLRAGWARQSRRIGLLLLPALSVAVVLALLLGNNGIVIRERLQVVVMLLPLIGLGWSTRRHRLSEQHERSPLGLATPVTTPQR
jgi:hypothetical protein